MVKLARDKHSTLSKQHVTQNASLDTGKLWAKNCFGHVTGQYVCSKTKTRDNLWASELVRVALTGDTRKIFVSNIRDCRRVA